MRAQHHQVGTPDRDQLRPGPAVAHAVPTRRSIAQIHHVVDVQQQCEGTAAPPMPCHSAAAGRATS